MHNSAGCRLADSAIEVSVVSAAQKMLTQSVGAAARATFTNVPNSFVARADPPLDIQAGRLTLKRVVLDGNGDGRRDGRAAMPFHKPMSSV
jgi:hypothetical protein